MTYSETIDSTDRVRVRLILDEYADEPYDEGQSPLIRQSGLCPRGYGCYQVQHIGAGESFRACDDRVEAAAHRWGVDSPLFAKYLRAYHGVTRMERYASDENIYVTYDDAGWRGNIGAPSGSISLDEYRAWCEGDVWGYVIEKHVHWTTDDEFDDMDTWEETESCWGFYGHEYAVEAARETFADHVASGE